MKTPTNKTAARSFSRKKSPVKNTIKDSSSKTIPVRCETQIIRNNIAVLTFRKETGQFAYMSELTKHLDNSSDHIKEDLKLIDISTILNANGTPMSFTTSTGRTFHVKGIIVGFDNPDGLRSTINKICIAYSNVTTPYGNQSTKYQAKLGCIKGSENDSDLKSLC